MKWKKAKWKHDVGAYWVMLMTNKGQAHRLLLPDSCEKPWLILEDLNNSTFLSPKLPTAVPIQPADVLYNNNNNKHWGSKNETRQVYASVLPLSALVWDRCWWAIDFARSTNCLFMARRASKRSILFRSAFSNDWRNINACFSRLALTCCTVRWTWMNLWWSLIRRWVSKSSRFTCACSRLLPDTLDDEEGGEKRKSRWWKGRRSLRVLLLLLVELHSGSVSIV